MAEGNSGKDYKIKISLDVEDLKKLDKATDQVEDFSNKSEKGFKKSSIAFGAFIGTLGAGAVAGAFNFIIGKVGDLTNYLMDGAKAAMEKEDSINKLNSALAMAGNYSQSTSQELQDFASSLQGASKFTDDAIMSNMAYLQSLTKLDKDGLKVASQAAVDMATATGQSLDTVYTALAKAANGSVDSLKKYGIEIKETGDKTKDFEAALDQLNKKFSGQAANSVNTLSGSLFQMQEGADGVQESLGNIFVKNPAIVKGIQALTKVFASLEEYIKKNEGKLKDLATGAFVMFVKVGAFVIDTTLEIGNNFIKTAILIDKMGTGIVNTYDRVKNAVTNFFESDKSVTEKNTKLMEERIRERSKEHREFEKQQYKKIRLVEDLQKVIDEGEKNIVSEVKAAPKTGVDQFEKMNDTNKNKKGGGDSAAEQLAFKEQQAREKLDKWKKEQDDKAKSEAVSDLEFWKAHLDEKQALEVEANIKKLEGQQKYSEALKLIEQTNAEAQYGQWKDELRAADTERWAEDLGTRAAIEAEDKIAKLEAEGKFQEALVEIKAKNLEAEKNQILYFEQWKDLTNKERLQKTKDALGELSKLQNSKNKEMFRVGQAASAAQAAIATGEGAIKAYTSLAGIPLVGPALGIAAAAALVAYGVEQQRNIWSQKPQGFATGGVIGMGSLTGDNNLITVNRKERVLTAEQNRSFEMLALEKSYGNQTTNEILLAMLDKVNQAPVIIMDSEIVNDRLQQENSRRLE